MGSRYEQKSSKTPKRTRLDPQTGLGTTQTPTARKARAGGKGAIPGRTRRGASRDASGVPATSSTEHEGGQQVWGAPRDGRPRASGEVGDSVPFPPGRRGLKPPEAPPRLPDRRRLTAEEPTLQPAGPGTRRSASCPPLAAVRRVAAGKGHRVAAQTRRRRGARREAGGAAATRVPGQRRPERQSRRVPRGSRGWGLWEEFGGVTGSDLGRAPVC